MEKTITTITLGDSVRVTDPSYTPDLWCSHLVKNLLPGNWVAEIKTKDEGDWGERVSRLSIHHEDYKRGRTSELVCTVPVDSGQAGFFDPAYYDQHVDDSDWDADPKSWYRRVADQTIDHDYGDMDGKCAFSSSGCGDGVYDCCARRNNSGFIVALEIRFL